MSQRLSRLLVNLTSYNFRTLVAMSEPAEKKAKYDGQAKKRQWEERRTDKGAGLKRLDPDFKNELEPERVKRRKFALLLGYLGRDYYGMQRNPNMKTIEEELLKALLKVELVTEDSFNQVQNIQFQRAARTDKGVSASRQVVSLKIPEGINIPAINEVLPEEIRLFSAKRVTKGFNSKSNCDARTYAYILPTIAFAPEGTPVDMSSYRVADGTIAKVNNVLSKFLGTRNFHNFTSKKRFTDPSANRFIISFECQEPFVKNGVEFAIIRIKGQSFMLHQIRKMIGLTLAVVRGITTEDTIQRSYTADQLDIPMAPGLGLVLDQLHYDRYNERYKSDHDTLDWLDVDEQIKEFSEKVIYTSIVNTEIEEKIMEQWLQTLTLHSYDVREDKVKKEVENREEDSNVKSENSDETTTNSNTSILFESDIGWLISHQLFTQQMYENVLCKERSCGFRLNSGLFYIYEPYKKQKSLKMKDELNSNNNKLMKEILFVREKYDNFLTEARKNECLRYNKTSEKKNDHAVKLAEVCYEQCSKYQIKDALGANHLGASCKEINETSFIFPRNCKFFCKKVSEISIHLADETFDLILLDPPWWNKYIRCKNSKTSDGYEMMYTKELADIPIKYLLCNTGLVAVWCTNNLQHFDELCGSIFSSWNVKYLTTWFWVKITMFGEVVTNFSQPGGKQPYEKVVFGCKEGFREEHFPRDKIILSVPSALHSHKPPLNDLLKKFLPLQPKCLEIFARYLLTDWTSFGIEATKFQHESCYEKY